MLLQQFRPTETRVVPPSRPLAIIVALGLVAGFSVASAEDTQQKTAAVPEVKVSPTSWKLFRGNSFATGVAKTTLPKQPTVLWRHEVPNGAFEATPVIKDNTVYLGDLDGTLFAFDLETGQPEWQYKINGGFVASPAVANNRVFVGDYDGKLHCVDATDGKLLWSYESQAEISSSVNFFEGNVIFGSQDTTLYCLDSATGKEIWKHQIQDQIRCAPTIVAGRCFVAGCDQMLHIIDVKTGTSLNSVPINAPTGVTPAVDDDLVFFGTEAGTVFGVNWRTAKVAWTYADDQAAQPIRSCPAVSSGTLVIGGRSKKVYAIDTTSGQLQWKFSTRNRVDSSPVIVGERVFIGSGDGRIYALSIKDGEQIWEYQTGAGFTGSPAVAAGRLVIANQEGTVYCFGADPRS